MQRFGEPEEIGELVKGSYQIAAPRSLLKHGPKNPIGNFVSNNARRGSRSGAGS